MVVGMDLWKLYLFRLLSYPNPLHTTYSQAKRERKSCQKNYPTKQYTTCGMKFCRVYFCESAIFLYVTETNFCDCKRLCFCSITVTSCSCVEQKMFFSVEYFQTILYCKPFLFLLAICFSFHGFVSGRETF